MSSWEEINPTAPALDFTGYCADTVQIRRSDEVTASDAVTTEISYSVTRLLSELRIEL